MSRQLDQERETREVKKRDALFRALEFSLVGALEFNGVELIGFSLKYEAFDCRMVVKAVVAGVNSVCFLNSDTLTNCILKADSGASRGSLNWKVDKYHPDNV